MLTLVVVTNSRNSLARNGFLPVPHNRTWNLYITLFLSVSSLLSHKKSCSKLNLEKISKISGKNTFSPLKKIYHKYAEKIRSPHQNISNMWKKYVLPSKNSTNRRKKYLLAPPKNITNMWKKYVLPPKNITNMRKKYVLPKKWDRLLAHLFIK